MKKWVDCLFLSLQNFLRILFATNVAKYRIFISADDIYYRFPDGYCQEFRGWADSYMDLYVMGYAIAYPLMVGYAWVSGGCTDVRYLGASLEKPSFWPDEMN